MACSVCKGTGHNKRSCVVNKIDASGLPDELRGAFIDHLTDGITDEVLVELISLGLDCAIPGAGWVVRLGRAGWRASKKY